MSYICGDYRWDNVENMICLHLNIFDNVSLRDISIPQKGKNMVNVQTNEIFMLLMLVKSCFLYHVFI